MAFEVGCGVARRGVLGGFYWKFCWERCRGCDIDERALGFGAVVNEIPVGSVFEFRAMVAIVAGEAGIFSGLGCFGAWVFDMGLRGAVTAFTTHLEP